MGDRYFLDVICKECGFRDDKVYYAPTCGFVNWECPKCGTVVDLKKLTGISYADASNRGWLKGLVDSFDSARKVANNPQGEEINGKS